MFETLLPQIWFAASYTSYAALLWIFLRLTRPAYFALLRRRGGYGTVFNSATGKPESLVTVRLRNLHGSIVRTVVTDRQGRYRLTAPKDEYYVEVDKAGLHFPSTYLGNKGNFMLYDNILPSAHIIIKEYGTITKNIPIDPINTEHGISILRQKFLLSNGTQSAMSVILPLVALTISYLQQSIIAWAIFIIYILTLITRLVSFKPADPPFGTIRDEHSSYPLDKTVVRLFEAKYNKLIETQVTSSKGRYAFVVNRGGYNILIKKDGYKSVMLKFPNVKTDGFLLAKDVRLKPGKEDTGENY